VRLIHNTSRAYRLFRGGLLDVTAELISHGGEQFIREVCLSAEGNPHVKLVEEASDPSEYPETASARLNVHNFPFREVSPITRPLQPLAGCVLPCFGQAFWALGGADEFTDLLDIYSLTPGPPAIFRNLNDYDVGAMARHPSVLPSSRAHQNMGTRYGSDCDQGQRRPGWAYLSPM
jgi:hypothetical protein